MLENTLLINLYTLRWTNPKQTNWWIYSCQVPHFWNKDFNFQANFPVFKEVIFPLSKLLGYTLCINGLYIYSITHK